MLQNWYFCAALGLSPTDTAAHLNIIAALEEPAGTARSEELVRAAVDCLSTAETGTLLHALPYVLAAHRRFRGERAVAEGAFALYRTIGKITPGGLGPALGALLREAGGGDWGKAVDLLASSFDTVVDGSSRTDPALAPYLDLTEQFAPTLVLSVARFVAHHRHQLVRERLGKPPVLLKEALLGERGRLALTQAAEFKATVWPEESDSIRRALAKASGGSFDMEPDLLMSAARVSYGRPGADSPDGAALLDRLENEALAGTGLLAWVEEYSAAWGWKSPEAAARRQAAYVRLGGRAGHHDSAMPAVLWQSTLTALAVEYLPGPTVERLAAWWQPPAPLPWAQPTPQVLSIGFAAPDYARVLLHTSRLLGLRTPPGERRRPPRLVDGPAGATEAATAAWAWSPWMLDRPKPSAKARTGQEKNGAAKGKGNAAEEFLADDEPEQLIRLLAAGLLAERLLTDGSRQDGHPDFLLLLIIHVRDVIGRRFGKLKNAIRDHDGRSLVPGGHLAGLVVHTLATIDRVGKGVRPTVHPAEMVRVLTGLHSQDPPPPFGHALRNLVHYENGLGVALTWATESSAGGVGPHRTEAGGRWFTGELSAADTLFGLVSEQPGAADRYTAVTASLLRREIHGDEQPATFAWDWEPGVGPVPPPAVKDGRPVAPDHKVLLLSAPSAPERRTFSVDEWEVMADALERASEKEAEEQAARGRMEKKEKKLQHVPLAVRTLRLTALLQHPSLGDEHAHQDWVASWSELVESFNSAAHLPRMLRGRLLDMFRAEVSGAGSQERLIAVLERVIDVIIELSGRATLYYDRLFTAMGGELALPAESANRLRLRMLRSFYERWANPAFAAVRPDPFDIHSSGITARGTEQALVDLLLETAHRELQFQSVPLGKVMAEAWRQAQRPPRFAEVRQDTGAVTVDSRFVIAATVDRRSGESILYRRNERLDIAVSQSRRLPVHDLFASGSDSLLPGNEGFVLGIVAGTDNTGPGTRLWLNCGLPRLVSHDLPRLDRRWSMGRTVAVQITPGAPEARSVAALATPQPCAGEVRGAELRSTDASPALSLKVDGIATNSYPSGSTWQDTAARMRWDPDLSRSFAVQAPVWHTKTLAEWHEEYQRWVPRDAGLPELAVAGGELSGPGGPGHAVLRLVLCGPAADRTGYGSAWRFTLSPGRTYVLGRSAWETEDWRLLERICTDASAGIIVYAGFPPGGSRLSLMSPPSGDGTVVDRRNARWLAAFTRTGGSQDSEEPADHGDPYEEAVRTTGPNGATVWQIEVAPIEGFPQRVTAVVPSGQASRGQRMLCTVKSWGEPEARQARVEVTPVNRIGIQLEAGLRNFEITQQFEEGLPVEIDLLPRRDPAAGYNLVRTRFGICGQCETESLTLTGEFPTSGTARRWAVVVKDTTYPDPRPQREPAPLTHQQFVGACTGLSDPAAVDGPTLTGMVTSRMRGAEGELPLVVVWLHLGDSVVEARIPVECFDRRKPEAGAHVKASRSGAGWTFAVLRRDLRLRALWTRAAAPGRDWKHVGQVLVEGDGDGDDEVKELYQDRDHARLATTDPGDVPVAAGGRARATKARWPAATSRAILQMEGRTLVGTASGVLLTSEQQTVHLEQTSVFMADMEYSDDQPQGGAAVPHLVEVSRRFVLSPAARTPSRSRVAENAVPDPAAEQQRVLAAGVIPGQLTSDGHVLLQTGRVQDDAGTYRPWLAVLDEPQTLVAGRTYDQDRVRCVPVAFGRGYRASHVLVPPVSLPEFMAEVLPQARPNGRRCKIRATREASRRPVYVGAEETTDGILHRFEFGYGWFLDVPAQALTVGGKAVDPRGLALFHGDRVDAVSFGRDTTGTVPGGITMDIAAVDITKGIEDQVRIEAERKVVHLLDVDVDHVRKRVAVRRVSTGTRNLDPGEEDDHVRDEQVSAYLVDDDVKRLLAAPGPGKRGHRILARLEAEPQGRPRRALRFTLVPPIPEDGDNPGLRQGDSLYLTAGKAFQTSNDTFLRFVLPTGIEGPGEPLTAEVGRRDFSHRENCLRRAVETDGGRIREDVYEGQAKMLVRLESLYDGRTNRWGGSTKSPRARSLRVLRGYLGATGDCFGVVAAGAGFIEVRPGVLFPASEVDGAAGIAPGSVVRLRSHGAEGVSAHIAIPADSTFLRDGARPVVVFPKDRLKTAAALDTADSHGSFTIAGLPGLKATAAKGSGRSILRTAHPKITSALGEEGQNARLVPLRKAMAGRILLPDADDHLSGVRVERLPAVGAGSDSNCPGMAWSRLSFMDGSALAIADACRTRYWRYHDVMTRQWLPGQERPQRIPLPDKAYAVDEPVFFSPLLTDWTLRHEPTMLRRFGFPATELVENTRPTEAGGRTAWAVAHADRRSVWLELAPGRVAEVCAELVRFADGSSLADLDWSFFSPGDLVHCRVEGGANECGHVVLEDWHPGVRGAFGSSAAQRMLLPVERVNDIDGALFLGEGRTAFPYPADQEVVAAHPQGSSVWLDRSNGLTALRDSPVAAQDVVFLFPGPGGRGLRVLGLPNARVLIGGSTGGDDWPGCDWLREALIGANRDGVLPAGLTGIAVTVEHVAAGPVPVLTVTRRAQPSAAAPAGSVLVQPVADLGQGYVAVRSGAALFRVHMTEAVPGLPGVAAAAAAAALVAEGGTVKMHWSEEKQSLTGIPPGEPTSGEGEDHRDTTVSPWLAVDDADGRCHGLVCRDQRSFRLCWLPAREAAWAGGVSGTTLLRHLSSLRRVAVVRTGAGTVSLTGHALVTREYENLTPGQRLRVTVVDPEPATPDGATADPSPHCLVAVEPMGMLAVYTRPPTATAPLAGESMALEVSRVERGPSGRALSLVDPGSRRTAPDLPEWVTKALDRLYHADPVRKQHPVDGLVDQRFRDYLTSYQQGLAGVAPESSGPGSRVLWFLGRLEGEQEFLPKDRADAAAAVNSWICSPEGRAAVLQRSEEVDLTPALAVCHLGARLGDRWVRLPEGWLAYLLARIGDRATSSLHTEALVTEWITRPERHRHNSAAVWRRLRTVRITTGLDAKQVTAVLDFGEAIIRRPEQDEKAAPVARGLMTAVGALPDAHALRREDAPILGGLADLGAGLRPAGGEGVPQWGVLSMQRVALRSAVTRVLSEEAVSLTLLPAFLPLSGPVRAYGKRLLKEAERRRP